MAKLTYFLIICLRGTLMMLSSGFLKSVFLQQATEDWFFESAKSNIKVKPHIWKKESLDNPGYAENTRTDQITIELVDGENTLILDLKANRDLLVPEYRDPQLHSKMRRFGDLSCEWQGVIRGEEDSLVAISICPVIQGILISRGTELFIEATPGTTSPQGFHQLVHSNTEKQRTRKCGVRDLGNHEDSKEAGRLNSTRQANPLLQRKRRYAGQHGPLWTKKDTLYIELMIVADYSFYREYKEEVYDRIRAIANVVNALYRPLGIIVVLKDIEVWTRGDKITMTEHYNATLQDFSTYWHNQMTYKSHLNIDNSMLITTVDFKGETVGYAYVSGICSTKLSTGVIQDKKRDNIGTVAQTMAHEMGHNLGMSHDEVVSSCSCSTRKCIMGGKGSYMFNQDIEWSSCSQDVIRQNRDSVRYSCLRNVPTSHYLAKGKTCGNGILDKGEECDCGPSEFCESKCCIADTCKLSENATCATGSCCNLKTCHPHKPGYLCRESGGKCDLPEYCSGHSEYCPTDVYSMDGTSCDGGKGFCHKGSCGNPDAHCKKVWGDDARLAGGKCYESTDKGSKHNNCGWTDQTKNVLKKCSKSSSECGTLYCTVRTHGEQSYGIGWVGSTRGHCNHVLAVDSLPQQYWLAPDGSPCGRNKDKMCVNQQCKTIQVPNGVTSCPKNCSNRGVCNNKGNCHCDLGYAPPDCASSGNGGSYDSNHIYIEKDMDMVVDGLLLLLAIMVPIIALILCSWEKIRRRWDHVGYQSMKSSCPCCAEFLNGCCCPMVSKFTTWFVTVKLFKKDSTDSNGTKKEMPHLVNKLEASTICQVSLDMKEESHTNSWGVADERLFTEIYKVTPKNSPDMSRKIMIGKDSTLYHHVSSDDLDRVPTFQHQSVSVDSGCVSDDDVSIHQPLSSQMSMSSLIGMVSRFGNKSFKAESTKDVNQRSKDFGSQKSIPLSRFVVDPLKGNRRSRHGTPPPDVIRHSFNRSVSTDASSAHRIQRQGPILPPSSALKPNKSDENLNRITKQAKKRLSFFGKNTNSDEKSCTNQLTQDSQGDYANVPILPNKMKNDVAASKVQIARPSSPPPPSLHNQASKDKTPPYQPSPLSMKTNNQEETKPPILKNTPKITLNDNKTKSNASGVTNKTKKPLMPPNFRMKSSSNTEITNVKDKPINASLNVAPKVHLNSNPGISSHYNSSELSHGKAFKDTKEEVGRINVKALAKRLDFN